MCFSAFGSNTPGRHCRKNVQTHDMDRTCTLQVCLLYALQAKSASIDVTNSALSGRGLLLKFYFMKETTLIYLLLSSWECQNDDLFLISRVPGYMDLKVHLETVKIFSVRKVPVLVHHRYTLLKSITLYFSLHPQEKVTTSLLSLGYYF